MKAAEKRLKVNTYQQWPEARLNDVSSYSDYHDRGSILRNIRFQSQFLSNSDLQPEVKLTIIHLTTTVTTSSPAFLPSLPFSILLSHPRLSELISRLELTKLSVLRWAEYGGR